MLPLLCSHWMVPLHHSHGQVRLSPPLQQRRLQQLQPAACGGLPEASLPWLPSSEVPPWLALQPPAPASHVAQMSSVRDSKGECSQSASRKLRAQGD